jgi:hypothetical protein
MAGGCGWVCDLENVPGGPSIFFLPAPQLCDVLGRGIPEHHTARGGSPVPGLPEFQRTTQQVTNMHVFYILYTGRGSQTEPVHHLRAFRVDVGSAVGALPKALRGDWSAGTLWLRPVPSWSLLKQCDGGSTAGEGLELRSSVLDVAPSCLSVLSTEGMASKGCSLAGRVCAPARTILLFEIGKIGGATCGEAGRAVHIAESSMP